MTRTTTRGFRHLIAFFIPVGLILIHSLSSPGRLNAQSQGAPANPDTSYSRIIVGPIALPPNEVVSQVSGGGPGLTIIPTFTNIDAPTQAVINNAIAYYEKTFTNNITVNIEFHTMSSGLGQSETAVYGGGYSGIRAALGTNPTSADDATALANTPSGSTNPVSGSGNLDLKSANGRAIGLNTAGFQLGGTCPPAFVGDACIGINVTEANILGDLISVVEHEMDEVLGLGSSLGGGLPDPSMQDLFRWASSGTRSFATNPGTVNTPCPEPATPLAFFSIDGGNTNVNQFNNCNNGGDYGDWITHTPSQVQDAFTNGTGTPSLLVGSAEVRDLDVLGYNVAFKHFAQVAVWRPSTGQFFVIPRSTQGPLNIRQWGTSGDVALRGDFDGDGITDLVVWRPSTGQWFIIPSSNPGTPIIQQWGASGDIPVPGDYDGDGVTDFAVFRPSNGTWYIIPSSNPGTPIIQRWGTSGDIPVPGDYDGDRKTDISVFRPSNGIWYIIPSSNPGTPIIQQWGASGDAPVPGDYDGDGKTDFAVWRSSNGTWYVIPSGNPGSPILKQWGTSGDTAVAGDYDGDGKTDMAVWRPSNGVWYVIPSSAPGTFTITQWGASSDVPMERPIGQ